MEKIQNLKIDVKNKCDQYEIIIKAKTHTKKNMHFEQESVSEDVHKSSIRLSD